MPAKIVKMKAPKKPVKADSYIGPARRGKDFGTDPIGRLADLLYRSSCKLGLSDAQDKKLLKEYNINPDDNTKANRRLAEHRIKVWERQYRLRINMDFDSNMYVVLVGDAELDPNLNPDYLLLVHPSKRFTVMEDYPQLQYRRVNA